MQFLSYIFSDLLVFGVLLRVEVFIIRSIQENCTGMNCKNQSGLFSQSCVQKFEEPTNTVLSWSCHGGQFIKKENSYYTHFYNFLFTQLPLML